MKLSDFFIDRPIFAGVISAFITIAGLIALFRLPISEYPEVVPPQVVVHASYPGANPKVIADTVAAPLEQAIVGVEDMLYMSSTSTMDGSLTLTVTFRIGADIDRAQVQVQNRVSQALPRLPEEVRNLGVNTVKASSNLTLVVNLTSPSGRYDSLYLRNYAVLNIRDVLARLPGMGDVQVFGGGDYSMRVWLDPQKLAARNLTAGDVVGAIREQNVQVAAGQLGAPPSPNTEFQIALNAAGRLTDEQQFRDIIVKTGDDGQVVRLGDVARVELGAQAYGVRSLLDNKPSLAIPVFQSPGANALELSTNVRKTMEELKKNFPEGMDYGIVYDPTQFVRQSIEAVVHTLLEAVVLVVLVVILFLQTWRASLIPLIAVPVSVIGTFAVSAGVRLLYQHPVTLRAGAGDRYRGRRCHRGRGERRASHRTRSSTARSHQAGHERGQPSHHRDHPGAGRGVRAGGVHQWADGRVLPAVRAHDRYLDGDLGVQLAHPFAGTGRGAAEAPWRQARLADARDEPGTRPLLPALQHRLHARW